MGSFAHLHVHTEYSLLDGMSRIKDLADYAAQLGMTSLAITDHGVMYGIIEFYRACKEREINPIIGMEAYMAPRRMTDRHPEYDRSAYHLLLLAENQVGYKNLLKIATASQLEGFYYRPRIDHEFLAAHAEGLICTTGCMAAEIPQMILEGREEEARKWLGWYQDVFGPDNFFIELQEHDIPELHKLNRALVDLAPYAEIPMVATNDVHYVRREDADPHDVLLCIGTSSLVSEKKRLKFSDDSYYLRSPEEMAALFAEVPSAVTNTGQIAERCHVNLDDKTYKLPVFSVPEGFSAETYLRHLCIQGIEWRYGGRATSPEIQQRLNYELDTIHEMGFDAYFLIVWDLCEFARSQGIWWNVRGSGAGSVVAYSLGITNIDPLENGLLFERFLNPERVNMPDIDIDYPDDRRSEMIEYCVHKYGEDKVAQIITFGTLGARAAIRDVGRTLDIPLGEVDALARMIPAIPGKPVTIKGALEQNPDLKTAYDDPDRPYIRRLLDTAMQLEGIARHASTHAAGVLIADKPLVEYTPLNRATGNAALDSMSQWPMEIVDSIGLLKVDFLGLRTLTIMRKACDLIEHYHGIQYNLDNIPYRHRDDDPEHNAALDAAFALLSHGETSGVFQVEGAGMTRVITEMQPSRFEHIVAAISLFRPGPLEYIPTYIRRMHGEEAVAYHHDLLKPILSETFGIIVYQEQIMQIASQLFGYPLGDADLMRRAVSKKKAKDLKKHRAIFIKEGPKRDISDEVASQIFDDIDYFARYGFNKSHAADYAVLTLQTAFLKAHYPHEYMTALLTVEHGDTDKVGQYINDCRRMEIAVLPPDINTSYRDFTIELRGDGSRAIRYGMSAIKNVGDGSIETILTARGNELFQSLEDFSHRTDLRAVGKRALESLIKVGALDSLAPRLQLLDSIERMMSYSGSLHKAADVGQMSLFGETTGIQLDTDAGGILVSDREVQANPRELLQWERELVGVYVSEHPLQAAIDQIEPVVTAYSNQLGEADHDREVTMAGMVTHIRPHMTKNGKPMAFAGIEDLYGTIEVVIWPSTWETTRELWEPDRILLLRGKIDAKRGEPKLLCDKATNNFDLWLPADSNGSPIERPAPLNHAMLDRLAASAPVQANNHELEDENPLPEPEINGEEGDEKGPYQDEPVPDTHYGSPLEDRVEESPSDPLLESDYPEIQALQPLASNDLRPVSRQENNTPRPPGEKQIRIHLDRCGDPGRDKRRLERIYGLMISYPGSDQFSIILHRSDRSVEVAFPNKTIGYCPQLEQALLDLGFLDDNAIQVLPSE
nr:DNA polymerase III subunit alpha [Anaerolineae bacterium]